MKWFRCSRVCPRTPLFLYCHSKQAVFMPHRNMIFSSSVNFPVISSCSRLHILSWCNVSSLFLCSFYCIMVSLIRKDFFQTNMLCLQQSLRYNVTSINFLTNLDRNVRWYFLLKIEKGFLVNDIRHWLNFFLHWSKLGIEFLFLASGRQCLIFWSGHWMW